MGLGSGAENHTLLINLGISIHFKSTIPRCVLPFAIYPKQKFDDFILQIAYRVDFFYFYVYAFLSLDFYLNLYLAHIHLNAIANKQQLPKAKILPDQGSTGIQLPVFFTF